MDRHVDVQREPGQFNRNGFAQPSASGAAHGTAVGNRGDNKIKPSHVQPRGAPPLGNKAYDSSSKPVDLSGFAGQNGQVRTIQPQRDNAAPPRTGMPGGFSRPAPVEGSDGKQYSVRQAPPAEPAPVQQSAPQPSFKQQDAPQPVRAAPTGDYPGARRGTMIEAHAKAGITTVGSTTGTATTGKSG